MEPLQKVGQTVEWLRTKVKASKTKGLLVGLSGGIDSALCGYLIKKAFPDDSLGIIMPCNSNPQDKIDALKVAKAFELKYLLLDLENEHDSLFSKVSNSLKHIDYKQVNYDIARANLKARLRMSTLYAIANTLNYLVVGTDNAAEIYTGYFTKYGDGGVDLLPIGRLTKREVRQWAQEVGVPQEIITKAPSAGLWDDQTDESEMGTTYDIIDDFLEGKEIPEKDRLIIDRLHTHSNHKRETPSLPPIF